MDGRVKDICWQYLFKEKKVTLHVKWLNILQQLSPHHCVIG